VKKDVSKYVEPKREINMKTLLSYRNALDQDERY